MDEVVVRGKLKLKKQSGCVEKNKSKAKKNLAKERIEAMIASGEDSDDTRGSAGSPAPTRTKLVKTKAEMAFEKRQAEIQADRVKQKAKISHRDRVEKFNKYLENLTEINDIPKVSWTK